MYHYRVDYYKLSSESKTNDHSFIDTIDLKIYKVYHAPSNAIYVMIVSGRILQLIEL